MGGGGGGGWGVRLDYQKSIGLLFALFPQLLTYMSEMRDAGIPLVFLSQ